MGINHDEFSEGVEPIKPITAKATTAAMIPSVRGVFPVPNRFI